MNLRYWLRQLVSPRPAVRTARPRLAVEPLESRDVPSALAVSDVTVREGPTATGVLDPSGPAAIGLSGFRAIEFDTNPADAHYGDLFVVGSVSNSVVRLDWATQTYQPFVAPGSGGMSKPATLAIGPDGGIYVKGYDQQNNLTQAIFRYDGATGLPLPAPGRSGAVYAEDDPGTPNVDESGGMGSANWGGGITFGADGNLYTANGAPNVGHQVLRFQGPNAPSPGAFVGVFVNITNMSNGPNTIAFGPDGSLYANGGGLTADKIDRFDGVTGAPVGDGVFVAAQSGGLSSSRHFVIDPLGQFLYVVNMNAGQVMRFQGPNGPTPGAFVDTYITQGQSGLTNPIGLAMDAAGNLYVGERDANQITRFAPSAVATFTVTLNSPSASPVSVNYATANGTAVAGTDYTATSGTLTFAPGETSKTVSVPITTVKTGGPTKAFTLNLSAASGATVADGQGVGSILNRVTKFFVADGGSPKTYQYGSGGTSEEITAGASGNTAPRGAASTAAGDKTWVVDANKTVYVYSNHGVLLGSWAAGSLSSIADIEGITVWGSDVWLVDAYQDRVYKYAGAASRLSGSQPATSNFALNGSNSSPKDLVTDGASIWVVNDGSTDKVFKYTLAGSLQGSWTMTGGGGSPTGITLDPTGASQDLWVVDNATDKVYRYAAARSLTAGTAAAASAFALNPSDTNPQGIADPPTAGDPVAQPQLPEAPAPLLSVALPGNLLNGAWVPPVETSNRGGSDSPRVTSLLSADQPLAEGAGVQRNAERPGSRFQHDVTDDAFAFTPMFAAVDADALLAPDVGRVAASRW